MLQRKQAALSSSHTIPQGALLRRVAPAAGCAGAGVGAARGAGAGNLGRHERVHAGTPGSASFLACGG